MSRNGGLMELSELIEKGNIKAALPRARKICQNEPDNAYPILLKLNCVCFKNIPELSSPSVAQDVNKLVDIVCQTFLNSSHEIHKCVHPLYHVTNYLIKIEPLLAQDVCKYFFKVDTHRKNSTTKEEIAIYSNLVYSFSSKLLDRLNELKIIGGDDSVESWLAFIFRLCRLRGEKLQTPFQVLQSILTWADKNSANRIRDYIDVCFSQTGIWLAESAELNQTNTFEMTESFLYLIQLVVVLLPEVEDLVVCLGPVMDTVRKFKIRFPGISSSVSVIESSLLLCKSLQCQNGANHSAMIQHLTNLSSCFANQPPTNGSVLQIVHTLMYKSRRNFISAKPTIELCISHVFSILLALSLNMDHLKAQEMKKSNKQLEIVFLALAILNGASASKGTLENVFSSVKKFFKLFCKAAAYADKKMKHFSASVGELLNVVQTYKKAELTLQTAQMCQYMFTVFVEMDPDFLSGDVYFKNYTEFWLKTWCTSCSKNTTGVDAQVMLIIFAHRHPKFAIEAMKAWATLKTSKAILVRVDTTVLDVLSVNGDDIEKNNTNLRVEDFSKETLLLAEAYAYSKHRELYGEPVLNVYKAAAKYAKKNYVALANILCCTVDAFSYDVNDKTHFATLDASVANMITHLQRVERDVELTSNRSSLYCSLGNLFYYKSRLERQCIRLKAEAEVSEEKQDIKIPVIRSGEKDDLDVTEIVAVGSSLKMKERNAKLIGIVVKALEFWRKCVSSLEPNILLTPTFSAIKGAGYLLRLYGYKELEASCWDTLFHISAKLGSEKHQYLAAGELMLCYKTVDRGITTAVDSLKFDKKGYACHIYQINTAKNLLFQGKVDECRKAMDAIHVQTLSELFLLHAQYTILLTLFNINHPENRQSNETPLSPIVTLFENLMYLVFHNQWETHNEATVVQLLIMETVHLLGTFYSDMKYVRPARCYIKCGLPLCKKLALPVRVCQMMTLGCWVDLLTWNVTESEFNAQEVESLLELGVLKLDDSETVCSPRRNSGLKIVPHFLSNKECKCLSCSIADYPSMVLNAISNRVLILIGNDGHREASKVVGVGLKVVEFVKEKYTSSQTLSTVVTASVARFYYVLASAHVLWENPQEAVRYAKVALGVLESAPIKNISLEISIERLLLGVRWTQSYVRPEKPKPVSRRFRPSTAVTTADTPITPENTISTSQGTYLLKNHRKPAEHGYYNVVEVEKLSRKPLYPGEGTEDGCEFKELDGISKLAISPVPAASKTAPSKTYGTHLHVPNSASVLPNTPEAGFSDVPVLARKVERPVKTGLFFKCVDNKAQGSSTFQTPKRPDDNPKTALFTPPNPINTAVASSTRKARTEKKPKAPKANILGTPCMAALAKIGIGAKTPAIKVYYDPEGLESTAKKTKKTLSTIKKPKRIPTKADDRAGTPKARSRGTKEKVTMDEDDNDEIELVSAQFKRLLAQKDVLDEDGTFKKPTQGKHLGGRMEEEKVLVSTSSNPQISDLNKIDESGSTVDSFHSASSNFDDTFNSLTSDKKPSIKDSIIDAKHRLVGASTYHKTARGGLASKADMKYDTAGFADSSAVIVAPFRKVLSRERNSSSARPIFDETIQDVINDDPSLPASSINREQAVENPASNSQPPKCDSSKAECTASAPEPESSRVAASSKTRRARRAVLDDISESASSEKVKSKEVQKPALPESAAAEEPPRVGVFAKIRNPRRAIFDESVDSESTATVSSKEVRVECAATGEPDVNISETEPSLVVGVSTTNRKARRAIFDETVDFRSTETVTSKDVPAPSNKIAMLEKKVVELTNETLDVAAVPIDKHMPKEEVELDKSKVRKTTKTLKSNEESDLESSMIAAPFRKVLAKKTVQQVILYETKDEGCAPDVAAPVGKRGKTTKPAAVKPVEPAPTTRTRQLAKASKYPSESAAAQSKTSGKVASDIPVPRTSVQSVRAATTRARCAQPAALKNTSSVLASAGSSNAGKAASKIPSPNVKATRGKKPKPAESSPLAKTGKSAVVPPSRIPSLENVDPSPDIVDSSIIESSFVELTSEMKLPLAARSLADEMNKLSVSSEPSTSAKPNKTNTVQTRSTRRHVK